MKNFTSYTGRTIVPTFLLLSILGPVALAQNLVPPFDTNYPDQATIIPKPSRQEKVIITEKTDTTKRPLIVLAGQRLVSYLTNVRSAIERSKGLSDEEKTKIIASLNQTISSIQTQTATVSNTSNEEDLDGKIAAIKNFWQEKQNTISYYLSLIEGGTIQRTIDRFRTIETKLTALYGRFEPSPELMELKKQFSSELDAAEASYTEARDAFLQIKTPGDHKELFKTGMQAFRDAHKHLKEARIISRKLISAVRELLGTPAPKQTSTPSLQP